MRIGLQTWGSDGDIRPMIALAAGLCGKGHDVTLHVASVDGKDYSPFAREFGFNIHHTSPAPGYDTSPDTLDRLGLEVVKKKFPPSQMRVIVDSFFEPFFKNMVSEAEELCRKNDLIISHYFSHPTRIVSEKLGRPEITVMLAHEGIPGRYTSPSVLPDAGPWLNPLLWRLAKTVVNRAAKPYVNRLRRDMGLPDCRDIMTEAWTSHRLNLLAVSRVFCKAQPDWPAYHHLCGFFNMPGSETTGDMPDELAAFISGGDPPVYMTFGSLTAHGTSLRMEVIRLLAAAARMAGCRTVIQVFPEDIERITSSSLNPEGEIFYTSPMPHQRVFPHCSVVVHHGGAGTTHSATRAGCPSIVVAHVADQEFWGGELRRAGLAPKPLHMMSLSEGKLAKRIRAVLDSEEMKRKAKDAGEIMRAEDGVSTAVEIIERYCTAANKR